MLARKFNFELIFVPHLFYTEKDKNEDPHSSDKTNVYLKFHLRGSDASALFVDGGNFWEKIKADVLRGKKLDEILDNSEDEDKFLTLLEPFNFSALVEKV